MFLLLIIIIIIQQPFFIFFVTFCIKKHSYTINSLHIENIYLYVFKHYYNNYYFFTIVCIIIIVPIIFFFVLLRTYFTSFRNLALRTVCIIFLCVVYINKHTKCPHYFYIISIYIYIIIYAKIYLLLLTVKIYITDIVLLYTLFFYTTSAH